MIKKLTKHGNSAALVIDKPILSLIGATPDTLFNMTTDGTSLILTPIRDEEDEKRFHDTLEKIAKRYKKAFEKLS